MLSRAAFEMTVKNLEGRDHEIPEKISGSSGPGRG
jgi:hypothetical protein